jgi:hypothetical protein
MHRHMASTQESGPDAGRPMPAARSPLGLMLGAERSRLRRAVLTITMIALASWAAITTLGCVNIRQLLPGVLPQVTLTARDTATPEITNTVLVPWPATWTPTATRPPTSTPTPRPTRTPIADTPAPGSYPVKRPHAGGTLTVDFRTNRVWCTSAAEYKIEFAVWARGGDGVYTYYRDIDKIGGPTTGEITYTLKWTDCGGAPGTFFVKSGDGQKASKVFWVDYPSCCTDPKP